MPNPPAAHEGWQDIAFGSCEPNFFLRDPALHNGPKLSLRDRIVGWFDNRSTRIDGIWLVVPTHIKLQPLHWVSQGARRCREIERACTIHGSLTWIKGAFIERGCLSLQLAKPKLIGQG